MRKRILIGRVTGTLWMSLLILLTIYQTFSWALELGTVSAKVLPAAPYSVVPNNVVVTTGGPEVVMTIRGSSLERITSCVVIREMRLVAGMVANLGPLTASGRQIMLRADRGTLAGDAQLRLITGTTFVDVPLTVARISVASNQVSGVSVSKVGSQQQTSLTDIRPVVTGNTSATAQLTDQKISSYSADLVTLNPQGLIQQQAKIYITPNKIRMDTVLPTNKAPIAIIFRRDTNVLLVLNLGNKSYFSRPLNEAGLIAFNRDHIMARGEKALGNQTVSGFTCSEKSIEATVSFRGGDRKILTTICVSPRLDLPIRIKSQDGSITELRNIKADYLQEAMFYLPGDYKRVSTVRESWR